MSTISLSGLEISVILLFSQWQIIELSNLEFLFNALDQKFYEVFLYNLLYDHLKIVSLNQHLNLNIQARILEIRVDERSLEHMRICNLTATTLQKNVPPRTLLQLIWFTFNLILNLESPLGCMLLQKMTNKLAINDQ